MDRDAGRGSWLNGRAVVVGFVLVQAVVPAVLYAARWVDEGSHPVSAYRYSWQMFSVADSGEYVGTRADGAEISLDLSDLPIIVRGIGYDDTVPRMLCERHPDLVSVRRENVESGALDEFLEDVPC